MPNKNPSVKDLNDIIKNNKIQLELKEKEIQELKNINISLYNTLKAMLQAILVLSKTVEISSKYKMESIFQLKSILSKWNLFIYFLRKNSINKELSIIEQTVLETATSLKESHERFLEEMDKIDKKMVKPMNEKLN